MSHGIGIERRNIKNTGGSAWWTGTSGSRHSAKGGQFIMFPSIFAGGGPKVYSQTGWGHGRICPPPNPPLHMSARTFEHKCTYKHTFARMDSYIYMQTHTYTHLY